MLLLKPDYKIWWHMPPAEALELLEWAGRTCYKSEEKIGPGTSSKFVRSLLSREPPHESVIEHVSATVLFIVDRGCSHELVRHRLASYSQESTRYCDYAGGHIAYIIPPWIDVPTGAYDPWHDLPGWNKLLEAVSCHPSKEDGAIEWLKAMANAEGHYRRLRNLGWRPEQARDVLPISLKTEVVTTFNLRQWRHVFRLRTSEKCHPQMREVMVPLLEVFRRELPEIFEKL